MQSAFYDHLTGAVQWYEYFLFATSCVHVVCITFQSGTMRYGPNFFLRYPDYTIVDALELALLVLYTCVLALAKSMHTYVQVYLSNTMHGNSLDFISRGLASRVLCDGCEVGGA